MKPNLKITSLPIAPPAVASLGETFQVSFQGINDGTADITSRWFDYLYLSSDNILDNSDIRLTDISASGFLLRSLAAGDSYTSPTRNITIPNTTTTGNQFLLFATDVFNRIDESDETDNVFAAPIEIKAPNLTILGTPTAPNSASLAERISIEYTVTNNGSVKAPRFWSDNFYISDDATLDNSDTFIGRRFTSFGTDIPLAAGDSYTKTDNVTIPNTVGTGNKFLLFQVDRANQQGESDETDNVTAIPIQIRAPNLTISGTPTAPAVASLGETISLEYTVTNNGSVTAAATWSDRFYISDDATLDDSDIRIGTRNRFFSDAPLAAGDSYIGTRNVTIPNTVGRGNKFLLFEVDRANRQGESDETDNVTAIPIQIGAPNLQLSDATVPTFANVDSTFQVEWEVTNNSTVTASANWFDYIYLSDDDTLDNSDTRLVTQSARSNTPLAGGSSYTVTTDITLPDTEMGNRYLLFVADANSRQGETDETDNVRAVPIQIGGLAIDDVTVVEGDSGTNNAIFTVTRVGSNTQTATVDYSTADDTATAGQDYVATNGTLTFNPGETTKTITVGVNGDTDLEVTENFFVNLTNPTNTSVTDSQGVGTIQVDEFVTVDSEISLLVDISPSISSTEYNLQIQGYAEAFENPDLYNNLISQGVEGEVAVNLVVWSGANLQQESVSWSRIDSVQASQDFAKDIRETLLPGSGGSRPTNSSTAPGSAINFAVPLFSSNAFEGRRWTIDVSGDGGQNAGADTSDARDAAIAAGVDVINGIVIGNNTGLKNFYDNNVIAGTNANGNPAFTLQTTDFNGFKTAINEKLTAELTPPPQIFVSDVSSLEGNSGTTDFIFDVSLSTANDQPITVDYTTADGTAIAGKDYTATNGTLTFNAGETSKTVTVSVAGENRVEIDENFFINLSNVTNGDIIDAEGEATITNDDEIQLSNNNVDENSPSARVIGNFSATDASDTDSFSFNLLDNAGGRFILNGSQLQVANGTLLDFESNTSHNITVRATDSDDNNFDKSFAIAVNDIDETPIVIDNQPPVANNDTATTDEDNSIAINVLTNDTDEDGDTLSITGITGSTGSVTIDSDNIIYNPNGQFESLNTGDTATDTFTYTVSDGNGLNDTATVTVTINGVDEVIGNENPVLANSKGLTVDEDAVGNITSTQLQVTDADNTAAEITYTITNVTDNGNLLLDGNQINFNDTFTQADINNNRLTYDHDGSETTSDSFNFTVADGAGGSVGSSMFDIKVNPVNDSPVANNDTASTNQNEAVIISVTDLLANDTDVEGDSLSITSVGNAANGSVVLNGNNVVFTPDQDFNGAASFGYTLSDGSETDSATVAVTVNSLSSDEILGTPGRDTLMGDNTDNIIKGFQGRDMLTGNGGADQFVYSDIRDAGDIITDFELGSDKIVLTQLLDSFGYEGSDAIGDGYVSFGSSRGDAFVQIDQDGMGSGFITRPLVLLQGVTEENLSANADNSFVF
ncbi:MAG: DUF1194 domain-containing protein [Rivularia sp. (in: cyanobacteria)]